jgi:tetratricopeptide (TPR) repeat protein
VSLPEGRNSPPPHIIGQIVEMGFTPQQARTALAGTDSGVNVQEALDSLLAANTVGSELEPPPRRSRPREPEDLRVPSTSRSRTQTPAVDSPAGSGALNTDKILAQATEIGSNLFSRANAFWKQGKEQMQKVYEEASKPSATPPSDGRPKWMQSASETDDAPSALPQSAPRVRKTSGPNAPTQSYAPSIAPSRKDDLASMFSDDAPTYVSPHRRRPGLPSTSARASQNPNPAPTVAAAPPRRVIQVESVSSSALSSCAASRTKGTEKFKLGQFAEAEAAYTSAITSLPPNHALLIVLYTNRAASRLKTGDSGGAAGDCTSALRIMGVSEDLGGIRDLELTALDGPGVRSIEKLDLKEQAIKSIQRRAIAFEAMERWERARGDWEKLAGLGWANGKAREEAIRSAGRCRKMVVGGTEGGGGLVNGDTAPASKPKSKSNAPVRREIQPSGEAIQKLQQAAAAQEAEDSLKADLKDSVDAKITAWKGGKENNLRALIASLENVLWPELGWVKVGMHELVTSSQVKIRYTKAIAKVHPDKVCPIIRYDVRRTDRYCDS